MDPLIDFLLNFNGMVGYLAVFGILILCGFGLPIPEDVILFVAGVLSYYGLCNIYVMVAVGMAGVLIGDSTIFFLGATYGRKLTKKWIFHRLLPDDRLDSVRKKFHKRGNKLIFAARFMPGFRAPIFFSAGTLHLPFRVFFFYDGFAALISVPLILGAVYYFGDELDRVIGVIKRVEHGIVFLLIGVVSLMFLKWYMTHRRLNRT